jgi:hypothetical protein
MIQSKILIYIVGGILLLGSLQSIFKNAKDQFFPAERMYSLEEAKLMLKHDSIINHDAVLVKEFNVIEKDNERLKDNIVGDSTIIYNSSRQYRDSIRSSIFSR